MRGITFILLCCICFILWQCTKGLGAIYTLSLYKIGAALVICSLVDSKSKCVGSVRTFCLSYSALMLYPIFPDSMKMPIGATTNLTTIDIIEYIFFSAWFLYAIGLLIYIYFSRHES